MRVEPASVHAQLLYAMFLFHACKRRDQVRPLAAYRPPPGPPPPLYAPFP